MKEFEVYQARLSRLGLERTEHVLVAELGEKILEHWEGQKLLASYPVSYSKKPRSCKQDSLGTPWGLHAVEEKHGEGQPEGMIFKGRQPTGQRWQELDESDAARGSLVTTRILRLKGLEPGLNAGPGLDSFDRYIYIHGTNYPGVFPENISAGCILMLDPDLLHLFSIVPQGTHVWLSLP